jgi:hypothetical protein
LFLDQGKGFFNDTGSPDQPWIMHSIGSFGSGFVLLLYHIFGGIGTHVLVLGLKSMLFRNCTICCG